MINKDFIKLVMIALTIATPIAFYFMNRWLEDFAYRITLAWWMFALAGIIALGVTLMATGYQSIRASLINPVDSLRSE